VLLALLLACVRAPPSYDVSGSVSLSDLRAAPVGVAPVVYVRDVPGPPLPPQPVAGRIEAGLADDHGAMTVLDPVADAAFLRNDYLGNVRFGGGFVRTGDIALEVRARLIEFGFSDVYAEQGARWLAESVRAALEGRRVTGVPVPALAEPPPLDRVRVRGTHPDDGHDNLNLPRTELQPLPMAGRADGPAYLLVPFLRGYYTHNGGWFIGHENGSMAGARVEALIVLYDARSGTPLWWMSATGRHIQPMQGQANRAELDQYLLWAEDQVEEDLKRALLR
jgi:hypothetical protein